ncbi:MAG: hypothetical protein K2X93_13245 [Candidatus Obscuribacterales bacterium]|nr:hypothetical protein [Candidatus Obscuribacterales bacterium]
MRSSGKNVVLYAGSTLASVLAMLILTGSGHAALILPYWAIAFWLLVGTDFYLSQVKNNGDCEVEAYENNGPAGTSFVDRFFAYLLFAPLILPARLYQLLANR